MSKNKVRHHPFSSMKKWVGSELTIITQNKKILISFPFFQYHIPYSLGCIFPGLAQPDPPSFVTLGSWQDPCHQIHQWTEPRPQASLHAHILVNIPRHQISLVSFLKWKKNPILLTQNSTLIIIVPSFLILVYRAFHSIIESLEGCVGFLMSTNVISKFYAQE